MTEQVRTTFLIAGNCGYLRVTIADNVSQELNKALGAHVGAGYGRVAQVTVFM